MHHHIEGTVTAVPSAQLVFSFAGQFPCKGYLFKQLDKIMKEDYPELFTKTDKPAFDIPLQKTTLIRNIEIVLDQCPFPFDFAQLLAVGYIPSSWYQYNSL